MQYESDVWKTADLLRGAGIKQSDFPKFMMPYFALMMVESRLIREARMQLKEFEVNSVKELDGEDLQDYVEAFKDLKVGYNELIIKQGKTLKDICKNDKTFNLDLGKYLDAYDPETKSLLGVSIGSDDDKYLNISGLSGMLKKKKILFEFAKLWAEVDLVPYSNSEITTLEEHIKRKWADISAETAGEQYTPDDIISLISEFIVSQMEDNRKFLTIYDATCGGGNLLYGVEDKIKAKFPKRPTSTFGMDWNDALYALAKIESRFRNDAHIEYGNTLTETGKFFDKEFDVAVANPPYGVDWKKYKKDIEQDNTERFHALPSVSDGQFLFTQHILSKLSDKGFSVVVHNGSTLFSGDAGSGESNIRKYFFDNDWVEAVIQLPTDEFFNTGIYTYLWVFNKKKPVERKDKFIMINASNHYRQMQKSKGKKRREMPLEKREEIVKAFLDFKDIEFAKVFDKWDFYFNKQSIMLTNVDNEGKSFEENLPIKISKGEEVRAKSLKLNPLKIVQKCEDGDIVINEFTIDTCLGNDLKEYYDKTIVPQISSLDYKEEDLRVSTADGDYFYDKERDSLVKEVAGRQEALGCGKIVIKASFKKATKTKEASISINVDLTADYEKDYEIVPYSPVKDKNDKLISDFMAKYITKPFEYIDNVVGVEMNFNKVFYKPEKLRKVGDILGDLDSLEDELVKLEKELAL